MMFEISKIVVIPAKAGIQGRTIHCQRAFLGQRAFLDSRFRGNDEVGCGYDVKTWLHVESGMGAR